LRSANRRFHNYKWQINSVKLDNSDITNLYNDSLRIGDLEDIDFQFGKADSYGFTICNIYYKDVPRDTFHLYSEYSFTPKNETFSISDFDNGRFANEKEDMRILNNLFYKIFNIRKLYKDEFVIKDKRNIEIRFIGR
jgi:hypothetical protein